LASRLRPYIFVPGLSACSGLTAPIRPNPPYLFLEVEKNPDALQHGRLVVLRIRKENLISHE